MLNVIPLSLYVHFPWCLRKCPYCDFFSQVVPANFNEEAYVMAILDDLRGDWDKLDAKKKTFGISSIYIGGGTPSLISPRNLCLFLAKIFSFCQFTDEVEITIEVNPGTVTDGYYKQLLQCGVNRISIGAQSFQDIKLQALGRIHNAAEAMASIKAARRAGFTNINLDLMFGLPAQSIADAMSDLITAISLEPTHISWYQLALEEGAYFYEHVPANLPDADDVWQIEEAGQKFLAHAGFEQYEISAYCQKGFACRHNMNYWLFGDYLGIGAGAHGKLTMSCEEVAQNQGYNVVRYTKSAPCQNFVGHKMDNFSGFITSKQRVLTKDLPYEFMMNALRLYRVIPYELFTARTGLTTNAIADKLQQAVDLGLLSLAPGGMITTVKGKRFLNDLLALFVE